ncbi:MAG: helix-turn-helix domain-containing protein [Bacteroidales bacterium]
MDNPSVKKNIAVLRKEKNLTQQEMADKLGISRMAYRNIETGTTKLISETVSRIAEIVGSTEEELVLGYPATPENVVEVGILRDRHAEELRSVRNDYEGQLKELRDRFDVLEKMNSTMADLVRSKDEIINMQKIQISLLTNRLSKE